VLQPMSPFKWRKLYCIAKAIGNEHYIAEGVQKSGTMQTVGFAEQSIPSHSKAHVEPEQAGRLTNVVLRRRLEKIVTSERHAIDTSVETLQLLNIIVVGANLLLATGISLPQITSLGIFLRSDKGGRVDFVKLDTWLTRLHIRSLASLQASVLVAFFHFDANELPFMAEMYPQVEQMLLEQMPNVSGRQETPSHGHSWSCQIRHTLQLMPYAPIEASSRLLARLSSRLAEIEE